MTSISEDQVLSLAKELWDASGSLTLDEVDGAFYWHLCRGELKSTLTELLMQKSEEERDAYEARLEELRSQGVHGDAFLDAVSEMPEFERLRAVFNHLGKMEREIPDFMRRLGHPARMRAPLFTWYAGPQPSIPCFQPGYTNKGSGVWFFLGIRDSQWRGDDVERVLREEVEAAEADNHEFLSAHNTPRFMPGEMLVFLDFKFYGAGELQIDSDVGDLLSGMSRWVKVESPVVMCTTAYPLPPPGIIAAAYDAIAIDRNRWDDRLYGAGVSRNQTLEVAIRTWAIGLLVGLGYRWRDAEALATGRLGQPISQPGFNSDRDELIKRVPEAERYLFQRRRRT